MTGERRDVFGLVDAVVSALVQRLTPPATQSDYLLLTHGKAVDMPKLSHPTVKDQMTRSIEVRSGPFALGDTFTFGDLVRFVEIAREQGAISGDVARLVRSQRTSARIGSEDYQLSIVRAVTADVNERGSLAASRSLGELLHKTGTTVDLTEVDEVDCVTTYMPKPEPIAMCPAVHPIEDVRCDGPAGHHPPDQHGAQRGDDVLLWEEVEAPPGRGDDVTPAHPTRRPQDTNAQPTMKHPPAHADSVTPASTGNGPHNPDTDNPQA